MNKKTKNILKHIVGYISILVIIYMWSNIDLSINTNSTKEEATPLIITTIMVTIFKTLLISGIIILIKFLYNKTKKNND